jgi:hypothetical protein
MEFVPEGATINKHRYKEILCCLCNSIQPKCSELWKNWLLLHNNAPAPQLSFPFPTSKKSYVGINFSQPRRLSLSQGKPYRTFLQISFSSASNSYTNVGRLAQHSTASILRENVSAEGTLKYGVTILQSTRLLTFVVC